VSVGRERDLLGHDLLGSFIETTRAWCRGG